MEVIKKTNKDYLNTFYAKMPKDKLYQTCDVCGGKFTYNNKSKHMKSKFHCRIIDILEKNSN